MSKVMINAGIVAVRKDSKSLVAICRTYQHPAAPGVTITLFPIPSTAHPSYWKENLYGLHSKFDRVLMEDGMKPLTLASPKGMISATLSRIAPFFPFSPIVAPGTGKGDMKDRPLDQYVTLPSPRDPMETRMAYRSTLEALTPPVDPRARRAVKFLETSGVIPPVPEVATPAVTPSASPASSSSTADASSSTQVKTPEVNPAKVSVVVPWGMYHMVYWMHRLKQDGWKELDVKEVEIVNAAQMQKAALSMVFMGTVSIAMTLYSFKMMIFG